MDQTEWTTFLTQGVLTEVQQELFKSDMEKHSVIEGRIGASKPNYGLDRITTKLVETSRTVIRLALFVMNAEKNLRLLCVLFTLFVSMYFVMLCMCASWHRPASLRAT